MTGIEALLEELAGKGISKKKALANMNFIETVLTVLSDEETQKQINLVAKIRADAEKYYIDAREKLRDAERSELRAQETLRAAESSRRLGGEMMKQIEEKQKVLEQKQQILDKALQVETAEARDRVRMYQLFMNDLPEDTSGNQNAVIYGAAAILSGQTVFTATAKPNKQ